ncbi:MAG: hypothetical protein R3301_01290 [Saprospiraceae bacterium]|nr:hypothetical protein [Saprospiraceae bacterium]
MRRLTLPVLLVALLAATCNTPSPQTTPAASQTPVAFALKDRGVLCSEGYTDMDWYLQQSKAPLFEGLDVIDYPVTTGSAEAQQYFNQGLAWAWGFNHAEAARSFYEAMRLDPECAMCHWGFAYVLGPNYNAGMEPDNFERAYNAIQKATELGADATAKERALIEAMATRYAWPAPEDRSALDIAYSEAMKKVYDQYPDDPEVAALYAESLMDLHPWDLYTHEGDPKPWTPGILEALDRVFHLQPDHPGAHHLYIHAVEASRAPERGYVSAQKFDDGLVPGSGHLNHMPSHIYIRTGDYHKGLQANIRAVAVDSSYLSQCHAQGAYPLGYYPHNMHFIAACGMYAGNNHWAAIGANAVSDHAHRDLMRDPAWSTLQHYYIIPYYIAVKFARWDEILNMQNFDTEMPYPEAIRHFARGMAFLGQNNPATAREELAQLQTIAGDTTLQEMRIWGINDVFTLLQIASRVLEAELLAREGNFDRSIALLSEAVVLEDGLQYQEPTDWILSVRHHLGAVLLAAGRDKDAIAVYKQDLLKIPNNGWALKGLHNAYVALGLEDQASTTSARFDAAWVEADTEIDGSRIW